MFRPLIVLGTLLLLLGMASATAQSTAAAVTFSLDGTTYIAQLNDDTWTTQALEGFMLTGQYDVVTLAPTWTADGRLIGMSYAPGLTSEGEPKYEQPATHLSVYDIMTDTFTTYDAPLAAPIINEDGTVFPAQILTLNSLSPGAGYATLHDIFQATGYLVDLRSGAVLFDYAECGIRALDWSAERVLVGGNGPYADCAPFLAEIDLSTGAITQDFTRALDDFDVYQFRETLYTYPDGSLLLEAFDGDILTNLGLLRDGEYTVIAPGDYNFAVSSDGAYVAFIATEGLTLADVATQTTMTITEDAPRYHTFIDETTLLYSHDVMVDGVRTLAAVTYDVQSGEQLSQDLFYEGPTPQRYAFSPDITHLATLEGDHINLYDATGQKIWDSTTTTLAIDTSNNASITWADSSHVLVELADNAGSAVLDLDSGEFGLYPPPEAGARWVSAAPDGAWWLYLVPDEPLPIFQFRAGRIVAYQPSTGTVATLFDAQDIPTDRDLFLESPFTWWLGS